MTRAEATYRKAKALFVHAFAIMTEYRAEIVIWMIGGSLPLIMMLIWMGLAEAGPVGGYGPADFAAYFLMVFFVRQLTAVWVVWELDREIRLGELSPKLLRPLDPYWGHVAANLAEKAVRLPMTLAVVGLGLWLAGARLDITLTTALAFLLALAGAWLICFHQQYSFGLIAFWKDQAVALEQVWFALYFAFAGGLAPLDLFPEALQHLLYLTPFPYMIDFPVQVLLGNTTGMALLQGFCVQAFWALFFILLRSILWRQGLRRYGAVGA